MIFGILFACIFISILCKGISMKTQENMDAYAILESDEFNLLLDAVELMAKAQGNLLSLQRSVEELKVMMDDSTDSQDDLSINDNIVIYDTLEDVQNLVDNLVDDFYIGKM